MFRALTRSAKIAIPRRISKSVPRCLHRPGGRGLPVALLLDPVAAVGEVVEDGREPLLAPVGGAVERRIAAAVVEPGPAFGVDDDQRRRAVGVEFGADQPLAEADAVGGLHDALPFGGRRGDLHQCQHAAALRGAELGGQVPLVRTLLTGVGQIHVGRRDELVGLAQRGRVAREELGRGGEPAARTGGHAPGCGVDREAYGAVQQPLPRDGLLGGQLIVDHHLVGVQQRHVAPVAAQRRRSESVLRGLGDARLLQVLHPHGVVASAIGLRGVAQTVEDVRSAQGAGHHAVGRGGEGLPDAVDQHGVVGARVTVGGDVVGIREVQVVARAAVDGLAAVEDVEAVLVGLRVAARSEGAGAEAQGEILGRRGHVGVHHHLARVPIPEQAGRLGGQLPRVGGRTAHDAVETHLVVVGEGRGALPGVPAGVAVVQLARQEVGEGHADAGGGCGIVCAVAESGTHRLRRPGIGQRLPGAAVPGVLQEVATCQIAVEHRHVVERLDVGVEVVGSVAPYAAVVEARIRSAGGPELVVVLHHLQRAVRVVGPVVEHVGALEQHPHVVLPEVVVEKGVLLLAAVVGEVTFGDAHHQGVGRRALRLRQPVPEQVVGFDDADGDVGRPEVRGEEGGVVDRRVQQRPQVFEQLRGIALVERQPVGRVEEGALALHVGDLRVGLRRVVLAQAVVGPSDQTFVLRMALHASAGCLQPLVQIGVETGMARGQVLLHSGEGRGDELRRGGLHLEGNDVAPRLDRAVFGHRTEPPVPASRVETPVRVVETPGAGLGADHLALLEVVVLRELELHLRLLLERLRHDQRRGVQVEFGLQARIGEVALLDMDGFGVLFLQRVGVVDPRLVDLVRAAAAAAEGERQAAEGYA